MSNICVIKNYYCELINKQSRCPRPRFVRFYSDLYRLLQLSEPDSHSYLQGAQYSYTELGDAVLVQCERDGILKNLDLFVVCYWTPEFDPNYSAGAYFCERYGIKGKSFDICDQGILSPIMAIKIIKSYFRHTGIQNALLLCIDQSSIPYPQGQIIFRPKKSSALGIFMQKRDSHNGMNFMHAKISSSENALFFTGNLKNTETILVGFSKKDWPFLNCAEIFRGIIYRNSIHSSNSPYFLLKVADTESNQYGLLLGRYMS